MLSLLHFVKLHKKLVKILFYENFILLCNRDGVSPSFVAERIGLNRSIVTRWSNGSVPRHATLQRLADYFNVTVSALTSEDIKKDLSLSTEALDPAVIQLMEEVKTLPPELLDLVANYVRDAKKIYRGME